MQSYIVENLFFNIHYTDLRIESAVKIVMHILNDIVVTTNKTTPYDITIVIEDNMDRKTYGMASWETKMIWLNADNFGKMAELNDISFDLNVSIILHEFLHTMDLIGGSQTYKYILGDDSDPPNVYTGPHGIEQYRNVLEHNQKDITNIIYLPLEDDFGEGTAMSHLEEGLDEDNSSERRVIGGTSYPVIVNEIMTGFLDKRNYLTPITLGLLEDVGFTVNYNSQYVTSNGKYLKFV
jgi:hypothetical protein